MDRTPANAGDRTRELAEDFEALSYAISHDLRAPIRAITGFSQILLEESIDRLDADGQQLVRMMQSSAQTLNSMIDSLLAYSRAGQRIMAVSEVNMTELFDEQIAFCESKTFGRKVRFIRRGLSNTRGDCDMIRQALACLLDNAVKFTRDRKEAVVEAGCVTKDGKEQYHIKDNGAGFDPEFSGKLFQMFQRLHSQEQFEGVGGGLAIARRIIQRHGGRIWAEAEIGAGAVFYFTLG
jgi:two-component system sensor histidine kinase/response regulator